MHVQIGPTLDPEYRNRFHAEADCQLKRTLSVQSETLHKFVRTWPAYKQQDKFYSPRYWHIIKNKLFNIEQGQVIIINGELKYTPTIIAWKNLIALETVCILFHLHITFCDNERSVSVCDQCSSDDLYTESQK